MSTLQLFLIILLGLILLSIIVYKIWQTRFSAKDATISPSPVVPPANTCVKTDNTYEIIFLSFFEKGMTLGTFSTDFKNVAALQRILNQLGSCLVVDGKFGSATASAMRRFLGDEKGSINRLTSVYGLSDLRPLKIIE